jgi:DICT domain-containing protein/predicted DNA-binding transcriptional regulator AlpA
MAELLSIGQVANRTGVSVPTLRIWEERHGFPAPKRLESGHRRYDERDCAVVLEVTRLRAAGFSLEAAIGRARREGHAAPESFFAQVRSSRPDLAPWLVRKRSLAAISRALEDEWALRAERGVLVGSFQRERFYRESERRWREFARTSAATIVLADFPRLRIEPGAPAEIPLGDGSPLAREWAIVADGREFSACLFASELPGQHDVADAERAFEAIWTVEPELVREATRIGLGAAATAAPDVVGRASAALDEPARPTEATLRAATALTNRIVSYLS